jgi:ketosteroid isomerase-like protein
MIKPTIRSNHAKLGIVLLVASVFSASSLSAQETAPELPFEVNVPAATEDRAAAYEVAAARAAWLEAFASQDLDQMMSFYVDDIFSYDLMAAPTDAGLEMAFDGEAIWRQNWVAFFGMFADDLVISIEDLTVYQTGDLATVYGLTRLEGTIEGGPYVDMWVRETNLLQRVDDRWLVLHDHVSVPFDFATGQALTDLGPVGN